MPAPNPRGPAHTNHLPSTHPSNPYGFSPTLTHAGKLPAKITDKYVFFFGYEGEQPEVCLQQWFPCPMVDVEGRDFPTTEHYMVSERLVLYLGSLPGCFLFSRSITCCDV